MSSWWLMMSNYQQPNPHQLVQKLSVQESASDASKFCILDIQFRLLPLLIVRLQTRFCNTNKDMDKLAFVFS